MVAALVALKLPKKLLNQTKEPFLYGPNNENQNELKSHCCANIFNHNKIYRKYRNYIVWMVSRSIIL